MNSYVKYFLLILIFFGFNNSFAATSVSGVLCEDPAYISKIKSLWNSRKPDIVSLINDSKKNPYNLYNVQIYTNNLLTYAASCSDSYIYNELLSAYLPAIKTLQTTNDYKVYYYPDDSTRQSTVKLSKVYSMWLDANNTEDVLSSSQFLFLISDAINHIGNIKQIDRTTLMNQFIKAYSPILLDHYNRWIFEKIGPFQVRGWSCVFNDKYVQTGMNHATFISKQLNKQLGDSSSAGYCNAVNDTDMWIIAGAGNLIAATKQMPELVSVPDTQVSLYMNYLKTAAALLESRITFKDLYNLKGEVVKGLLFDQGLWDGHPDYKYAGYTLNKYPALTDSDIKKYAKKNLSWDLSHTRRFVNVFGSLFANKDVLGLTFPSISVMQSLANQFVYGVFNRDFNQPLFSNYFDGSNGWFRVGYSGRAGFGYGPNDASIAALEGGFGFLGKYNADLNNLICKLNLMLTSTDKQIRNHVVKFYQNTYWNNYKRTESYDFANSQNSSTQYLLLEFYPTLYNSAKSCF